MEPLTITGSRGKTAIYLAISLVFVVIGAAMIGHPSEVKDLIFGWLSVVFFGLCVAVSGWLLVRPQVVRLDADGFSLAGGLVRYPKLIPWRDVQPFFVFHLPRGGKMSGLPKGCPKSPEAMAETLNDYRERALAFQTRWGRT